MNAQIDKNKGFTIIEVVLVLAIAALIFLMVFVALPALQRGQANSARKNDASTVSAAIGSYRTNTNGKLPATYAQIDDYIDELAQLSSPTGATALTVGEDAAITEDKSNLDVYFIYVEAKCESNNVVSGTKRQAAVITLIESSAGKYSRSCTNA